MFMIGLALGEVVANLRCWAIAVRRTYRIRASRLIIFNFTLLLTGVDYSSVTRINFKINV